MPTIAISPTLSVSRFLIETTIPAQSVDGTTIASFLVTPEKFWNYITSNFIGTKGTIPRKTSLHCVTYATMRFTERKSSWRAGAFSFNKTVAGLYVEAPSDFRTAPNSFGSLATFTAMRPASSKGSTPAMLPRGMISPARRRRPRLGRMRPKQAQIVVQIN